MEGCGLKLNWSFFTSCHGKCLCDPEGGTLKNSAHHHELTLTDKSEQLKDSEALYEWVRSRSGLDRPKLSLVHKKGRGIFRRFFYWIPSKGTGAVNRAHLPKVQADGTSKLHQFVDIGVVGTVSTRRTACHRCDPCWDFEYSSCLNIKYVGPPMELKITCDQVPAAASARINRAQLHRDALDRARTATLGSIVCVETHPDEQMHPWVIGKVI